MVYAYINLYSISVFIARDIALNSPNYLSVHHLHQCKPPAPPTTAHISETPPISPQCNASFSEGNILPVIILREKIGR